MYKLLEKLIIYAEGEGRDLLDEMADLCRLADEEERDLRPEAYAAIRNILKVAARYGFSGNLWQSIVALYIAYNENPFSLATERSSVLKKDVFAVRDCEVLKELFFYDFSSLDQRFKTDCFVALTNYESMSSQSDAGKVVENFKADLIESDDFFKTISNFYSVNGVGTLGLSKAFTVNVESDVPEFVPVRKLANITLSDLIGYQMQKEKLLSNTTAFLNKFPANNVLLFGDGGTGKSTSVRALANQFYDQGLRIIQIYRYQMQYLNKIIAAVKSRNYRFIIYMDDLSFEDFEVDYKYLKAVIEGGLEQRPENVLIYATSNRRHLVKEIWRDRDDIEHDGDIHRSDSVEEKLSLSDRFGVQIYYGKPTREEYHYIIEVLAMREHLDVDADFLHSEATKWEIRHGSVSGRSARQFIDYMKGLGETKR